MAYSPPARWSHGSSAPTAAQMNTYRDGLNDLRGKLGAAAINMAVPMRRQYWTFNGDGDHFDHANSALYMLHQRRYLHYMGDGKVVSVGGGSELSLPASTTPAMYDLESVDWLNYGMVYQVQGVQWAAEDND